MGGMDRLAASSVKHIRHAMDGVHVPLMEHANVLMAGKEPKTAASQKHQRSLSMNYVMITAMGTVSARHPVEFVVVLTTGVVLIAARLAVLVMVACDVSHSAQEDASMGVAPVLQAFAHAMKVGPELHAQSHSDVVPYLGQDISSLSILPNSPVSLVMGEITCWHPSPSTLSMFASLLAVLAIFLSVCSRWC